jgi:hypothetical protein
VHPIEHLRYVARAQGADPTSLVQETAHALGSLHFDPSGLVVACRRIVERHPFTGALWWLCANVATSAEPFEAVWELADEIRSDPTGAELAAVLPDDAIVVTIGDPDVIGDGLIRRGDVRVLALDAGFTATSFVRRLERYDVDVEPVDAGVAGTAVRHAGVVLVEALAVDSERAVVPIGSSTIVAAASAFGIEAWIVAGSGDACRRVSSMRWRRRSMRSPPTPIRGNSTSRCSRRRCSPTSSGRTARCRWAPRRSSPSARWPTNSCAPATSDRPTTFVYGFPGGAVHPNLRTNDGGGRAHVCVGFSVGRST